MQAEALPWELIFLIALALAVLTTLSLLLRTLRGGRKRLPLLRVLLLLLCLVLIAAPFLLLDGFPARLEAGLEANSAETSDAARFPELRTRRYEHYYDPVSDAAILAISQQQGWTLVRSERALGELQVEISSGLGLFTHDLLIRLAPDGAGTRVDARSQSRSSTPDLGASRRQIQQFFSSLEQQLR